MRATKPVLTLWLSVALLSGCGNGSSAAAHNEWQNIDYSSVYRKAGQRENDSGYVQPSVVGCVDDDLYNCR